MSSLPASIRVTRIGGVSTDLGWLTGITLPAFTEVEFVDFGRRVDVVMTRRDEEVSVVGDMVTGARVVKSNGNPESPLVAFALLMLKSRQLQAGAGDEPLNREMTLQDMASLTGAEYIPYGSVRWPLSPDLRADMHGDG